MLTTGLAGLILLASGAMADITPAVRADLAPTGKLRAAINYGNFILATRDKATGESKGAAIDLTQEIAKSLGVPVDFREFVARMGAVVEVRGARDFDAFIARDDRDIAALMEQIGLKKQ